VSRGWIIAAIIFFLLSCGVGGLVMAGLRDGERIDSEAWTRTLDPPDSGARDAG
jgi:hypothetical protein